MAALSKKEDIVPISEAAKILGVSIDTIRRWDKSGVIHSSRPNGKNRYFSIEELEKLKFSQPLSISEVVKQLGISASTLRRLEKKGLITPERNNNKERLYNRESIEKFLHGEYFLRQKSVEEKILEPLEESLGSSSASLMEGDGGKEVPIAETKHKIIGAAIQETREQVSRLLVFRRSFYAVGLFLVTLFVVLSVGITIGFLVLPEQTAKFFGYSYKNNSSSVLGAVYTPSKKEQGQVLGEILKPISNISLNIVRQVDLETYDKIVPERDIKDVNDILAIVDEGNITPKFTVKFLDSSYFKIPDKELIENLNASYVRGKVIPDGTIAVIKDDGTITNLTINEENIAEGAITTL